MISESEAIGLDNATSSELDGLSNVLIVAPTFTNDRGSALMELFSSLDVSMPEELVTVSYRKTAEDWLAEYRVHSDTRLSRFVFIGCGGPSHPDRRDRDPGSDRPVEGGSVVDGIQTPEDLTGLGIKLNEHLAWIARRSHAERPALTIDSLSILLQYRELDDLFRFLHVLTRRVRSLGMTGYYHVDPGAQTDRELNTLKRLADAVIERRPSADTWSILTR